MIGPRHRDVVLVVDDDPTLRLLARETLEQAGFTVEDLENGDSILTVCARVNPDIVLLDVHLPGRDGFALCAALRTQAEVASIPVLMMTAQDDADSIRRAFEVGATDKAYDPIDAHGISFASIQALYRLVQEQNARIADELRLFDAFHGLDFGAHFSGKRQAAIRQSR